MINIDSKLIWKKIKKGSNFGVLTAASAAALMLCSNGAFAGGAPSARTVIGNNANLETGDNLNNNKAGAKQQFIAGSTLQYTGDFTVTGANVDIRALDLNGKAAGVFTVTNNISLGSVVDTLQAEIKLPVIIGDNKTLTLTGFGTAAYGANPQLLFSNGEEAAVNDYTALGDITFSGQNSTLTIKSNLTVLGKITLSGDINGAEEGKGLIVVSTEAEFTGQIGDNNILEGVLFNNGDALSTAQNISARYVIIASDDAPDANFSRVAANRIIGDVDFSNDGILTVSNGIDGAVTTNTDREGTIIINGGNVTGNIGANGTSLNEVTFNNGNALSTAQDIFTLDVIIGQDANLNPSRVAARNITGAVGFSDNGILTVSNGIDGVVTTENNDQGNLIIKGGNVTGNIGANGTILNQVKFNNGNALSTAQNIFANDVIIGSDDAPAANFSRVAARNITGAVSFADNGELTVSNGIDGVVTTENNDQGNLIINGGNITGDIGANGTALHKVIFNNGNALSNAQNISAQNVIIGSDTIQPVNPPSLVEVQSITGNVRFTSDGVLTSRDGIDGAVTTREAGQGTLTVLEGVSGVIGEKNASLKVLNAKVDNDQNLSFDNSIYAQTVNFDDINGGGAVGTIRLSGSLIADTINFGNNAQGGTLEFKGGNNALHQFKGEILHGNNGKIDINKTILTAYHPTIGSVSTINISDGSLFGINVSSGDITILNNQVINFQGIESSLNVTNNTDEAKSILLGGNLNPHNGDGRTLYFNGNKGGLNVRSSADGTVRSIGNAVGNKFNILAIQGNVTISKDINLAGITTLRIADDADFTDNSGTSSNISAIEIEEATYTIETNGGEINILANGSTIDLKNVKSTLVLKNSSDENNSTITFGQTLEADEDNKGIVMLESVVAGNTLIITGGDGISLGGNHTLNAIVFKGAGNFDTSGITLKTANIELNNTGQISLGAITTNITLLNNEVWLTQKGNLSGFLDFGGKDATVTLDQGVNIIGAVQNTGGNNSNGTLVALGASTIGGNITGLGLFKVGAGNVAITNGGASSIGEIQGNGNGSLTLPADFNLTGGINATGGEALKLNFTNGGSVSGIVGRQAHPVGEITTAGTTSFASAVVARGNMTFGGSTSFANTFTNTGNITASGTTTFTGAFANTGNVTVKGITNFGSTFTNRGDMSASGTTNYAGVFNNTGKLDLSGTTSFADAFNNDGIVTLTKDSINNFASNITATSFSADNATINFTNDLDFNSNITGSGATLTLNSSQLVYTGSGNFTDTLTINTAYNGEAKAGGNILIKSGSTLDMSEVTKLDIAVNVTNIDLNNLEGNEQYKLIFAETADGFNPPPSTNVNLTINGEQNRFIKFTQDAQSLTLFADDIVEEIIEEEFVPGGALANIPNASSIKESLELMAAAPKGSDALMALNNFGIMTPLQSADAVSHLIQDVVKPSEVVEAGIKVVAGNISNNLTSLNTRMDLVQAGERSNAAVSSGDENKNNPGVWISPFVGNAAQKMRNSTNGYKANSSGGTVGIDTIINDELVLGAAYTRADTDIKLKNYKAGDKSKVHSNIYSLYGLYNLTGSNLFIEGIASFADSNISNKSRRAVAVAQNTVDYQIANGKYKSESYTGQIMAGYTYMLPEGINLTPLAGLRYSNIKDKGYKETGATFQNLIVNGKSYNTFDGIVGARVSSNINVSDVVLTPQLYAMVDYAFKNKAPAIEARLQGMAAPYPTTAFSQSKASVDIGAGITAKYKMMEYGINYDTTIANKYFAQQGSIKVRINL